MVLALPRSTSHQAESSVLVVCDTEFPENAVRLPSIAREANCMVIDVAGLSCRPGSGLVDFVKWNRAAHVGGAIVFPATSFNPLTLKE